MPGQTEGQTEGRMDRSYFKGPFQLLLGVQQVQLRWTISKSQRYREGCWSKIIALPSACKKSAQFINSFIQ